MTEHSDPDNRSPFRGGLRLCRLFGIDIHLDPSLALIFALLVYILGASVFPGWHPDWPATTTWLTALASSVLFFTSLLAHEMAHSLVSRRFGIEVRRITLFLFGGVAEIQEEPRQPRDELLIALAGPLTSLTIGILCTSLATGLANADLQEIFPGDGSANLAGLSPLATLLLWLGPINIILAIFNMVPGFPLDGGRVFRALVWWITGDLQRATQVASDSGRLFGWMLMLLGVVQMFAGAVMQGLWLVLIGWFLSNAASASYRQLVVRELFKGITVKDIMRTRFHTLSAQMWVAEFIEQDLLQSPQQLWPVVEDDKLIGLVTLAEVMSIPFAERPHRTVGQVMRTDLGALSLHPDTSIEQALARLSAQSIPVAIVDNGKLLGLLGQADLLKWIQLKQR